MVGHLDITCSLNARGHSHLARQSFRAPMHISKPHLDEETLVVNVVNPTAGLFEGDEVDCRARVESGGRLLLTSPSATRAHCMAGGGEARMNQRFSVAAGGWLEVFPEIFIPQGGARYRQKTTVELEEGAGFLFFETLAPGRVASGEVFAFGFLDWETDICWNGERVAREKYRVAPEDLRPLRQRFPTAYYACIFFFHPGLTPDHPCWESIGGVHDESTWVGHGRLHRQGWSIKVLSADSVRFRKALQQIRGICYEATGQCIPAFRKF